MLGRSTAIAATQIHASILQIPTSLQEVWSSLQTRSPTSTNTHPDADCKYECWGIFRLGLLRKCAQEIFTPPRTAEAGLDVPRPPISPVGFARFIGLGHLRRVCIHTCASALRSGAVECCVFVVEIALVIGICATLIPALNAAQVEPSQVLREEQFTRRNRSHACHW
jgi:hypothetical protein